MGYAKPNWEKKQLCRNPTAWVKPLTELKLRRSTLPAAFLSDGLYDLGLRTCLPPSCQIIDDAEEYLIRRMIGYGTCATSFRPIWRFIVRHDDLMVRMERGHRTIKWLSRFPRWL
jgi:hypothetical protein